MYLGNVQQMVLSATVFLQLFQQLQTEANCTAAAKSAREAACQPPWLRHEGHCYLYVKLKLSFTDAENYCKNFSKSGRPAHLASVVSNKENQFLLNYATAAGFNNFKIGLYDQLRNRRFIWTDGSTSGYRKWHQYEPSALSYGEFCVHIASDGTWFDVHCGLEVYFMCKIPVRFFCL